MATRQNQPYTRAIEAGASAVALVGLAVLIGGWLLDIRALRTVIPGAVGMKAATALLLVLSGAALVVLSRAERPSRRRAAGRAAAALTALIGSLVLGEYLLGWNPGIDELPFVDSDGRAAGIDHPGRFAPTTGVCFVLLGLALLLLDCGRSWRWRPSELLAVPIAAVSAMSLVGYAYSIPAFYGPASAAKMAVHTAACFAVLAVGILLARPDGRLLALAGTRDPAGVMVRRLAPFAVLGPFVLGWLHLRTVGSWSLFTFEVGTWWLTAATICGLALMICWCAATLSRSDRSRRVLEDRLYELANRDELTGLANRRRFDEELAAFLAVGRRYDRVGALVVFDLDGFKRLNDRHGHGAGDRVLAAVGQALTSTLRTTDVPARLGGDEFAVILREVDEHDAALVADKLVCAIADATAAVASERGAITASAGVAQIGDFAGVDAAALLERADAAMELAKAGGGNCVVVAGGAESAAAPAR